MPYPGVPAGKTKKMERCVRKVKAKGGVRNPYAVCHAAVMGKTKKRKRSYASDVSRFK